MTTEEKKKSEQRFQQLLSCDLNDKKVWDELWSLVDWCCSNICKAQLKGIRMDPETFEIRYQEAVFEIMEKIKNGVRPNSMSAYFYWPCRRALISNRAKEEDRESLSYDEYTNYFDANIMEE